MSHIRVVGYNEIENVTQNYGEEEAGISGSSLELIRTQFSQFSLVLRLGEPTDGQRGVKESSLWIQEQIGKLLS